MKRSLTAAALLSAVALTTACDGPPASTEGRNSSAGEVGQVQKPSCDEVSGAGGIRGRVVGSEWVDPDGVTCLEIETKAGDDVLIRVSRRVFDRCIERDLFPQCAKGAKS